ncbi:group I truncated hemoglobin [Marinicella gelatinilytica]|uniref:group I truncated hemoglobin n=1 Tax=Marinicella gelatinilytica TaxID=2996017 RepID=UPI002260E31A|nr:group 1 truncated hemoglobin [Marinicella gelatinilytica]MCX7544775.1 group 1 truncated hemoglobin [Marinicella gelatinilytica]
MKNLTIKSILFVITLSCSLNQAHASDDNLYQALGGEPVINTITKELLDRILNNEKIAFLFEDTVRDELHEKIVSQICMETGGPCVYEGLDMIETHSGMDIKYSEFDVFVSDFIDAMEAAEVPYRLQNKVLAIFASMREDITYE